MNKIDFGINVFGNKSHKNSINEILEFLIKSFENCKIYLVIANTDTSQIKGISAAGTNPKSRKKTALADAEFLLFGPSIDHQYKLPFLNAGVTPALISYVCSNLIHAKRIVVPLGIGISPYFSYLNVEDQFLGPAKCLTTGKSMSRERVLNLYKKGIEIGKSSKEPILIAESVPGGTTTAQAVMEAFDLNVSFLVGSSLFRAPRDLKRKAIEIGLSNANLKNDFDIFDVIASVGDPFQAFSTGLLIGTRIAKQPVILSGGSQMIAVLLLALENLDFKDKKNFVKQVFIATTSWLLNDNSLTDLLCLISKKHDVNLVGLGSPLNFKSSKYKELKDYEFGHVKEGVGAGGISILAFLKGFRNTEIVSLCQQNLEKMKELGQISLRNDS